MNTDQSKKGNRQRQATSESKDLQEYPEESGEYGYDDEFQSPGDFGSIGDDNLEGGRQGQESDNYSPDEVPTQQKQPKDQEISPILTSLGPSPMNPLSNLILSDDDKTNKKNKQSSNQNLTDSQQEDLLFRLQVLEEELHQTKIVRNEMYEYNKELQWTLMALKQDNDEMRDHLQFILQGGDPKELEKKLVDGLFDSANTKEKEDAFRSPAPNNVFDIYSEFQRDSAAVQSFQSEQAIDDNVQLRMAASQLAPQGQQVNTDRTEDEIIRVSITSPIQQNFKKARIFDKSPSEMSQFKDMNFGEKGQPDQILPKFIHDPTEDQIKQIVQSCKKNYNRVPDLTDQTPGSPPLMKRVTDDQVFSPIVTQSKNAGKQETQSFAKQNKAQIELENAIANSTITPKKNKPQEDNSQLTNLKEKIINMSSRIQAEEGKDLEQMGKQNQSPMSPFKKPIIEQIKDEEQVYKKQPETSLKSPTSTPKKEVNDNRKYLNLIQGSIERRASRLLQETNPEFGGSFAKAKVLDDIVKDYSRKNPHEDSSTKQNIEKLRIMAQNTSAFMDMKGKRMKNPILEKYFDFTLSLGLYRPEDSDLNLSKQGQMRRQQMYDQEKKKAKEKRYMKKEDYQNVETSQFMINEYGDEAPLCDN